LIYYVRRVIYKKRILMENRILLSILIPLFVRYQKKATLLHDATDTGSVWYVTQNTEINVLNQCLQVLQRRSEVIASK